MSIRPIVHIPIHVANRIRFMQVAVSKVESELTGEIISHEVIA